jgi:hypothetical protein
MMINHLRGILYLRDVERVKLDVFTFVGWEYPSNLMVDCIHPT